MKYLSAVYALLVSTCCTGAFNGHEVTEGPVTVFIEEMPLVTVLDQPQTVRVFLTNTGPEALRAALELTGLVDDCRAVGAAVQKLDLPVRGTTNAVFQIAMGPGSHSALYPVHVQAGFTGDRTNLLVRAVRIFETRFGATAGKTRVVLSHRVPETGSLPLAGVRDAIVTWKTVRGVEGSLAPGWLGSEPQTGTSLGLGPVARGATRQALTIHPPYKTGAGTMFVEYEVELPAKGPIQISFFNAIRDHAETEPPSDGVTFRVWVEDEQVFERHTDSKVWVPGAANLDRWAGQKVRLRLEGHPGPKQDTTCDSGFWGDPVVTAGQAARLASAAERKSLEARARQSIASGTAAEGTLLFDLADGNRAAVAPGPNGILDAAIAFGTGNRAVVAEGMEIGLWDVALAPPGSGLQLIATEKSPAPGGRIRLVHRAIASQPATVVAEIWAEGPGLKIGIASADASITDLTTARWDSEAARVFYGHGYCLVKPGRFRAGGGGHNLSTSHVGFEFQNGVSLLVACDTPPDYFQVDGPERIYQLHTHPDTVFTFVPGTNGAMETAVRYRPLYDKQAAPAVKSKAGRFVFDIWGGRYADDAKALRRCFDYGLTNALVIMHVWQRWGYDYRLPDIYPPLPSLGPLEDLQDLGRACDSAGVLWGLHDNYIDFYPDATGFSYETVTFSPEGEPRKAWLNEGRNAQSYQFRPDKVKPFLQRNIDLIGPALNPSSSFVDVWTSINAFDFHDRQGKFHSKMETLRCWGEGFAMMREKFRGGPTTSEAGSDQLIGWLDGADCQFMMIGQGKPFNNHAPCADWERVPWFDLVNHTRFSLHGVGYPGRYEGGRSRTEHGIESDDYVSAEMLTGHALMIDLAGMVRGAVRKYWLAQDFIESVAHDEIETVEQVGGDIHRLNICWRSGAKVLVNRGTNDWVVGERTLPPYGYLATNGRIQSSIDRVGGSVVERSTASRHFYVNGRGYLPNAPLAIRPVARAVEHVRDREFRLVVDWHAELPVPKDLTVFYHFSRPTPGRYTDTEFYGGGKPLPGTSKWSGIMTTGTNWPVWIPEKMPLGEYDILVGLYDPDQRGKRYRLVGEEAQDSRYRVGTLVVDGRIENGRTNVTGVRLTRPVPLRSLAGATMPNGRATDFGMVQTSGAMRVRTVGNSATLVPLPDGEPFRVTCKLSRLFGREGSVNAVVAIDAKEAALRDVPFVSGPDQITFTTEKRDYAYRVELR